ncbi:MAG: F0F1 ATP synthase subunit gamma, partial [Magnetococcales bacterium]|nr:F0F1 ATP synthase subunit gamma [Magnetococcales bacterium]
MAGSKEILSKIKSVQNTRKITKAMEMVAASKMRRAQERMRFARPYEERVRRVAAHLAGANPEYRHPFLIRRQETKGAGFIVVTTDKGLCGSLNTNVLRAVTLKMKELANAGIEVQATAIGNKGFNFLTRMKARVVSRVVHMGDVAHVSKFI